MNVTIVDYGMGNLQSIRRAFEECGADVRVTDHPEALQAASMIVLPGVGSFTDAMNNLNQMGLTTAIKEAVAAGKPLLGICLGMQILASMGTEGGDIRGLGIIAGKVVKLELESSLRIPHIGWNDIKLQTANPIFANIANGTDFYFVHSYHFIPNKEENILATTNYGGEFVSAVIKDNVVGVQFHPEKSQHAGFCLLKNFLNAKRRNILC